MPTHEKHPPAGQLTVHDRLVEDAALRFISALPEKAVPADGQLSAVAADVQSWLIDELARPDNYPETDLPRETLANRLKMTRLEIQEWVITQPLPAPPPTLIESLEGWKLAVGTMLGAFLGGLLLSGIFNLFMNQPQMGFILGSTLGAGAMVLAIWNIAESKKVRNGLVALLGLASVSELLILVGKIAGIGSFFSLIGPRLTTAGITGFFKRFVAYAGAFLVLKLSVRKPFFDRRAYRQQLVPVIDIWIQLAADFFRSRLQSAEAEKSTLRDNKKLIQAFGRVVNKLHQTPAELLPDAAAEVVDRARRAGFEGLEGISGFLAPSPPAGERFVWDSTAGEKYHVYGVVENGDHVFVESKPVIHNGTVVEKGLVRKVRGKRR